MVITMNKVSRNSRTDAVRPRLAIRAAVPALVMLSAGLLFSLYISRQRIPLPQDAVIEAGSLPSTAMFFPDGAPSEPVMSPKPETFADASPGEYAVSFTFGRRTVDGTLIVEDTTPPTVSVKNDVRVYRGEVPEPSSLVVDSFDVSGDVSFSYAVPPDTSAAGNAVCTLRAGDPSGNYTDVSLSLTVLDDTQPPVIDGVADILWYISAEMPDYSAITVTDDLAAEPTRVIDDSKVDYRTAGQYTVLVSASDDVGNTSEASFTLTVRDDTVPPRISGSRTLSLYTGAKPFYRDQIHVTDDYDPSPSFILDDNLVDLRTPGVYSFSVSASDAAGNVANAVFTLTVRDDTEPPVIVASEPYVYRGETVSYRKYCTVSDALDPAPSLNIDASAVDLSTVGDYPLYLKASDAVGNVAESETVVHVIELPDRRDQVAELARDVLAQITTPDMTPFDKAFAIFNYGRRTIGYTGFSDKSDRVIGAYNGFTTRAGDCFTYYSVAKVLLDEAGIDNIDVVKERISENESRHYWSLVNLGDGWYHFDPCSFAGDNHLFLLTDEELVAWDARNTPGEQTHRYDASLYPTRAEKSVQGMVHYLF